MNTQEIKSTMHYSFGYGGNYNYHTVCGIDIHSHSNTDKATVKTTEVTCPNCLKTDFWMIDNADYLGETNTDLKRRIFINSDFMVESELSSARRSVKNILTDKGERYIRRVFNDLLEYAWHDLPGTWEAVKKADEIYADTSLVPLCGGYTGAPVIFNGMCERAVKEKITGKDVYILNKLEYVSWNSIDIPLMKKAFKKNNLFMFDDDYKAVKIDIQSIQK